MKQLAVKESGYIRQPLSGGMNTAGKIAVLQLSIVRGYSFDITEDIEPVAERLVNHGYMRLPQGYGHLKK